MRRSVYARSHLVLEESKAEESGYRRNFANFLTFGLGCFVFFFHKNYNLAGNSLFLSILYFLNAFSACVDAINCSLAKALKV